MLSHVPLGKGRSIAPSCRAWAISSGRNVFLEQGFEGALYGAPPHLSEAVWLSQLGRLTHHDRSGLSACEVVDGVELAGGVVAKEGPVPTAQDIALFVQELVSAPSGNPERSLEPSGFPA